MNIAYIRVSSVEQNESRQLEALKKYEIDKYFQEKVSGKNMERKELQNMLDFVRKDDCIYVMDFSRLSRSLEDLLKIVRILEDKQVKLISLKENLDTSTAQGRLMLTLMGAINEFERVNLLERQREGIAVAKKEGKYKGRRESKIDNWEEVYNSWNNKEISAVKACEILGISRGTFYNKVNKIKK